MSALGEQQVVLAAEFEAVLPHLDERQRRLLLGAEARSIGHGGIRLVARAAGVREATVSLGVGELEWGEAPLGRVRRVGGGRKRAVDLDPGLRPALLALVEPDVRGDPMSPLRWTTKSTRHLAAELTRQGHQISADTAADVLREEGFSLQGNAKAIEGRQHPDRDGQFLYINEQARAHQATGDPVISVDTKKKEIVGPFRNGGREWRPAGEPVRVSTHDFPDKDLGKAVPYGIYDLAANTGRVSVGTDHDTAAFAVESIHRWWKGRGRHDYPQVKRLLVTADAGGSNGYRTRAWKTELAALALETGLSITVCHFPPGTSKWNRIEHRLFSHITMNWRGRPLTSHDVIVESIAATTTRTGLSVHAELDPTAYETGIRIGDRQMGALPLSRHDWHGDWNYTLRPEEHCRDGIPPIPPQDLPGPGRAWLVHPDLTGIPHDQWDQLITDLAAARETQREEALHQRRGGDRQKAASVGLYRGRRPGLTLVDRLLATLLYQRFKLPQVAIAPLFTVTPTTLNRAISQTRRLLHDIGQPLEPAATPLTTLDDLVSLAIQLDITPTPEIKTASQFSASP
ncbi:ISAzo13 family transposase [Streptomyces erythrochromogenes]|uniref:ISAzo13 family transposase n=1 Tax=Streptomyces erythrochromogenes TaxID=285574 RepID=UPI00367CAF1E